MSIKGCCIVVTPEEVSGRCVGQPVLRPRLMFVRGLCNDGVLSPCERGQRRHCHAPHAQEPSRSVADVAPTRSFSSQSCPYKKLTQKFSRKATHVPGQRTCSANHCAIVPLRAVFGFQLLTWLAERSKVTAISCCPPPMATSWYLPSKKEAWSLRIFWVGREREKRKYPWG